MGTCCKGRGTNLNFYQLIAEPTDISRHYAYVLYNIKKMTTGKVFDNFTILRLLQEKAYEYKIKRAGTNCS